MKYGLIGEKLSHSFSAIIHPKIADYKYELKEIQKDELESFMLSRDFCGINVTIPYKYDVIKYLDFVEDNALKIGAVNTIVNKNGKLFGYNTDYLGLLHSIKREFTNLKGKKALILGDGATSRTAKAVLETLEAEKILIVSRHPSGEQISYFEAENTYNDAEVIINATPAGMYPNIDAAAISLKNFNNLELVVDVIYNPIKTNLIIEAERKGVVAFGGMYMLVAQAVFAAGYFTEQNFTTDLIDNIYNELLNEKKNIVLIGMPASGKSTIGAVLSKLSSKNFIDTDEIIERKSGITIPEIFSKFGEAHFRKLESEVIKEISLTNNAIIATGGGAVLNFDNIRNLKHNGIIFFLDRNIEELLPTDDRPLSNTKDDIIKRYNERIDLYNSYCDKKVKVVTPEITAKEILRNI